MDDTIYIKTALGQETIQTRNTVLTRSERSILIMVDGKKNGAELVRMGAAMGMSTDAAALTVARLQTLGMAVSSRATLSGVPAAQPMRFVTPEPALAPVSAPAAIAAPATPVAPKAAAQAQLDPVAMKAMSTTAAIRIVSAAIQATAFVEPAADDQGGKPAAQASDNRRGQSRRKDEFLDSLADQVDSADAQSSSGKLSSQFGSGPLTKSELEAPQTNSPSFANFAEQFDVILGAMAAEIHSQLGLRGMDLSVKADNAQSVDDLKDIASQLYQVIARTKGAAAASNTQSRLDALFDVPVAH